MSTNIRGMWMCGAVAMGMFAGHSTAQEARDEPMAKSPAHGYLAAPPGTQTLTATVAPLSMHLYANGEFKGTEAMISGVDTTIAPGEMNEMPKGLADSMSSARWNLPHGVIVIFYEDAGGKGEQIVLWGQGQVDELSPWDFNDKASRWAWYDVGGGPGTSRSEAAKLPPNGSKPLDVAIAENSVQLFKNSDFKGDMHQVSPLTAQAFGDLHKLPGNIDDSMTSMRWNLPPGVVVTFYQDADGDADRVSIWGQGQISDIDLWDFNDKVSRWSWAYVGAPTTGMR